MYGKVSGTASNQVSSPAAIDVRSSSQQIRIPISDLLGELSFYCSDFSDLCSSSSIARQAAHHPGCELRASGAFPPP